MAKKVKDRQSHQNTAVGLALVIGAGIGATVGVIGDGGAGIAMDAGIGAAIGIVAGAAWDAFHTSG